MVKNPFRYRDYIYDNETGFYYTQSRYYDPDLKRWISADSQINTSQGLLGLDIFSYCFNNPINMKDYTGNKPGDIFSSIEEAARDFALCYNGLSISDNVEYGTVIYSLRVLETRYRYEEVTRSFINYSAIRGFYLDSKTEYEWTSYQISVIKYSYITVEKGDSSGVSIPDAPRNKKRVATAHTHAAYDPYYANDSFSGRPGDKENTDNRGVPSFVATPLGTLRRYNPSDGSDIELYTDIPWDSNHPNR